MEKNEFDCDLAFDLLPLYLEGATGEESDRFLQNHLKTCESCRETYELMRGEMPVGDESFGEKPGRKPGRKHLSATAKLSMFVLCYFGAVVVFLILFGYMFIHGF